VQLPPSLPFDAEVAGAFLASLRRRYEGAVACEPRHASWFTPEVSKRLIGVGVARVAADPPVVPQAAEPGAWGGLVYYRLHGSPKVYDSAYPAEYLEALAVTLRETAHAAPTWCIFDNTAQGAATPNALAVAGRLDELGDDPG